MNVQPGSSDPSAARGTLQVGEQAYRYYDLRSLGIPEFERLPYTVKVLIENALRHAASGSGLVAPDDLAALASWRPEAPTGTTELPFLPARVLLQDFTGVPVVVDLAAMRDAIAEMGGDPARINPLVPADLVIDHSVQVDQYGSDAAFLINVEREYERNGERYALLRWAQEAFANFRVVPPGRASSTRSTSSTSRTSSRPALSRTASSPPSPTPSWAPTPTRPWSTAWGSWAGAWAGSRPRPRSSASRCTSPSPSWWASGWTARSRRARRPPTWS